MYNKKMEELISELIESTSKGHLDWTKGGSRNSFQLTFPQYSIIVALEMVDDYEEGIIYFYSLTLIDEKGEVVDEAGKGNISEQAYNMLVVLFSEARKVAKKANEAYDYLQNQLKKE